MLLERDAVPSALTKAYGSLLPPLCQRIRPTDGAPVSDPEFVAAIAARRRAGGRRSRSSVTRRPLMVSWGSWVSWLLRRKFFVKERDSSQSNSVCPWLI